MWSWLPQSWMNENIKFGITIIIFKLINQDLRDWLIFFCHILYALLKIYNMELIRMDISKYIMIITRNRLLIPNSNEQTWAYHSIVNLTIERSVIQIMGYTDVSANQVWLYSAAGFARCCHLLRMSYR